MFDVSIGKCSIYIYVYIVYIRTFICTITMATIFRSYPGCWAPFSICARAWYWYSLMISSSIQSNAESSSSLKVLKQQSTRFSASQTATLNAYHRVGMKSKAESCMCLWNKAGWICPQCSINKGKRASVVYCILNETYT